MANHNAFEAHVTGLVQGVGYRYFAKSRARELGLTGWVRNLPQGGVELTAKGTPEALERFMHYLQTGPQGSRVEEVKIHRFHEPREFEGFEIRG